MCQAQFLDSGDITVSNTKSCEMKYFLPYRWARNVTAIHDFWLPNVNEAPKREHYASNPADAATPQWRLLRSWG